MSIDWLEDLERAITMGQEWFACPSIHSSEWYLENSVEELIPKAKRTAVARRFEVSIYRLVNCRDTVGGDSYLVVRRFLEPGPQNEPRMQWSLVDTREAAEMLRDVSQGPSPFFGAVVEMTVPAPK